MHSIAYLCLETPREGQATRTHVTEIVEGLRRIGWSVDLFATRNGGASGGSHFVTRLIEQLTLQFSVARQLSAYDMLYVRSHFMAWPLVQIARLRGIPVIQEVNGLVRDVLVTYPVLRPLGGVISLSYASQFRSAARLLAVTEGLADWAAGFAGHNRVSVVSNGANIDIFTPEGPTQPAYAPYVMFVGGLVAWHGIVNMLAAIDEPAWPVGLRLVVAGDGVERDKLAAMVGHPRFSWLGVRPQSEIAALLRGAVAALCVINDPEGRSRMGVAPLKLFEAMATGTPVIASDVAGQADLIRAADAGLVIPMADPSALAAAVAALAHDPERARQLGRNGARYVQASATWRHRADELAAILAEVLQPPGALARP